MFPEKDRLEKKGATTFIETTRNRMPLSKISLNRRLKAMTFYHAECRSAECHSAKCCDAEKNHETNVIKLFSCNLHETRTIFIILPKNRLKMFIYLISQHCKFYSVNCVVKESYEQIKLQKCRFV